MWLFLVMNIKKNSYRINIKNVEDRHQEYLVRLAYNLIKSLGFGTPCHTVLKLKYLIQ